MYWVDALFDKIEHSTFDGLDRRVLGHIQQMTHPFGLTVFQGMFWSDKSVCCFYPSQVVIADSPSFSNLTILVNLTLEYKNENAAIMYRQNAWFFD